MRKLGFILASLWLAFAPFAFAANVNIDGLPAATSAAGTDLLECEQGGINNKCTAAQEAAYVYGLMSGDATASGTGTLTLAAVNANVGSFGSATSCVAFTVNAKGLVTAASATTCTPAITAVTGLGTGVATALGIAPGTTGSFSTQDGAIVTGNCLKWGPGIQDAGAACGTGGSGISSLTPGPALVSSTTTGCSQSAITTSGTLSGAECSNAQVGTTYAIQDSDRGKLITASNTASQAYTIAQAGASTTFQSGWFTRIRNNNSGVVTITPTTSTICGAATLSIYQGQTFKITSDGTNYQCDGGGAPSLSVSTQTGANYAFVASNFAQLVNLSNASAQIPTLPQAGTTGFAQGWFVNVCNIGAGTQTITPTTSTIGGASTFVLPGGTAGAPQCVTIISDGTNYQVSPGFFRFGTNVAAAAGSTLSSAGGLTSTIASGTATLGTTAIASGACATVVTVTATNVATTDVLMASYNSDPTAVTGYGPSATGAVLTIYPYPTAGNANFKVCNSTNASITPGAMTLNWRAVR